MMTSAILFQLQEEGVLSIADPLSKWLPDLAAQLPNGDQITIDMLLTHTSGLHDYFEVPTEDGNDHCGRRHGQGHAHSRLHAGRTGDPGCRLRSQRLRAGRGRAMGLQQHRLHPARPYHRAGHRQTYEENLKERIFEPLDLEQTYLQTGQPEAGALPQAYYGSPFDFTTGEWNASQAWSAGAVVSTPEEFAAFLKALFSGQLFKDPDTLESDEAADRGRCGRAGFGRHLCARHAR